MPRRMPERLRTIGYNARVLDGINPNPAIEDVLTELTELTEWVKEGCAGPKKFPASLLYLASFQFRKFC